MPNFDNLKKTDPEIYEVVMDELKRQQNKIELIASENFVSNSVMEAMGSYLTNKYAEGYPAARYYGGCEYVDVAENLARERVKKIFGAEHANVQPHSGAQANMAVYFAIDYEELERLALENKPKMILAGASAYPREIDFARIREIADKVDALFMVDMAHIAGLVAAGLHQNPVKYADIVTTTTHKTLRGPRGGLILCKEKFAKAIDKAVFPGTQGGPLMHVIAAKAVCFGEALKPEFKEYQKQIVKNAKALSEELLKLGFDLVSGGTDNHLMLIDLRNRHITGKELETRLDDVGITVNKNAVPFDTEKPTITSGIRIGTPAVTTRGFKEKEMVEIAQLINMTVDHYEDKKDEIRQRVAKICKEHPLYT